MKTLVLGYGNPVRCDDGVGIFIAQQILAAKLPFVEVRTAHQLHVEMVEEFPKYDRIIFIDSNHEGPEVSLEKLDLSKQSGLSSSHYVGPEFLGILAKKMFGYVPELFLCTVRGENFNFENDLTPLCLSRSQKAHEKILKLIQENFYA